ncbi:essential MCU regulator, mitochondrial-like [Brienomyrus brachyistius]|uniref:essential MCU regulator, mitochondrial-like n=1 Tax=Brienomyrus brachyistius TaxID=42636 RepID=UPI0020B1B93E|nr:essential MCU regulator, mitochondrial-like [Brienomyrus brachyistius]
MASVVCRFSRLSRLRNAAVLTRSAGPKRPDAPQCRNAVATSTGAILPKPVKISFGLIRITVVVVPFLYVGTLISKNFAALLEEHDIFVPEDDDDDD